MYSCLYARPIKVVNVDHMIRSNHFYYFIKFMVLKQKYILAKNQILTINGLCLGQIFKIKILEIAKQFLSNF